MDAAIIEFVESLRLAGIPVTTGELMDSMEALSFIPFGDKETFKEALRTTLVKRAEHSDQFERIFALHFCHPEEEKGEGGDGEGLFVRFLDGQRALEKTGLSLSPLAKALLGGEGPLLERMALQAAREASLKEMEHSLQLGSYLRRMKEKLGFFEAMKELETLVQRLEEQSSEPQSIPPLKNILRRNREGLETMLRRLARIHLDRRGESWRRGFSSPSLLDKSFWSLTEEEIGEMRREVAILARKLKLKVAQVDRRSMRGRLNTRKTLRRNLGTEGVPFEMVFRQKKRKKSQVMALCDVSSSVWNASRFMLNLLYAIQDQFDRVRSFVFVSDLGEVTSFFERMEPNEAIEKALKEAPIRYHSYSDYGDVLLEFQRKYFKDVNSRTMVIIIGDGRNNYLPTRSFVLEELRERCRKLIWLNPEPRTMWGTGDSAMLEYAAFCTLVEECRNLRQLSNFVEKLIL
jgi:uncharacterized protein with von Willebrand factor type A (vWA) domain